MLQISVWRLTGAALLRASGAFQNNCSAIWVVRPDQGVSQINLFDDKAPPPPGQQIGLLTTQVANIRAVSIMADLLTVGTAAVPGPRQPSVLLF